MPVQNQYMSEKVRCKLKVFLSNTDIHAQVEISAFASSRAIKDMMKQMEEMYAVAFCAFISHSFVVSSLVHNDF
jgi:hypothetical protein